MQRGVIFLGDLLRGIHDLKIEDLQVVKAVVRMLSLEGLEEPPEATIQSGAAVTPPTRAERVEPLHIEVPQAPISTTAPLTNVREARLRPITTNPERPTRPAWLTTTTPLPRPSGATPPSSPFQPLFPLAQTRGILSAALATWDNDGPPNIPRVIEELAAGRPLLEMPRERAPTLRLGAQILIDSGLGMAPFLPDVEQARLHITRLLSRERAQTLHFVGTPRRGCVAEGREQRAWMAPPRGTPILLITELGIGGPLAGEDRADRSEWLEFFRDVAIAGCPLSALVPYGRSRWPRELAHAVPIIHWDRRTSAAAIRRALDHMRRGRP
jgi:hypothetical protein